MKLSRRGYLLAIFSAALVTVLAPRLPRLWAELTGPSFPDALLALGSLIATALAGWVLIIAILAMLGLSTHVLARITPTLLRGALLAGATGALAVGPTHGSQISGSEAGLRGSVVGLPLPDRPEAQTTARPLVAPRAAAVTVRPGDTLWAIAARSLPDGADDIQIAKATRAWHHANRDVIGADPHLIFPRQRLAPPIGKDHP